MSSHGELLVFVVPSVFAVIPAFRHDAETSLAIVCGASALAAGVTAAVEDQRIALVLAPIFAVLGLGLYALRAVLGASLWIVVPCGLLVTLSAAWLAIACSLAFEPRPTARTR